MKTNNLDEYAFREIYSILDEICITEQNTDLDGMAKSIGTTPLLLRLTLDVWDTIPKTPGVGTYEQGLEIYKTLAGNQYSEEKIICVLTILNIVEKADEIESIFSFPEIRDGTILHEIVLKKFLRSSSDFLKILRRYQIYVSSNTSKEHHPITRIGQLYRIALTNLFLHDMDGTFKTIVFNANKLRQQFDDDDEPYIDGDFAKATIQDFFISNNEIEVLSDYMDTIWPKNMKDLDIFAYYLKVQGTRLEFSALDKVAEKFSRITM